MGEAAQGKAEAEERKGRRDPEAASTYPKEASKYLRGRKKGTATVQGACCSSLKKMEMKVPRPWGTWNAPCGRSLLVWHLLLLCLAALEVPGGLAAVGPQSLLCYKKSCITQWVTCRWKAGNASKANYTLHLSYQDQWMMLNTRAHTQQMNKEFLAGEATSYTFDENTVFALNTVTIWVENHAEDSPLVSEKLRLQINEAVKFDPPSPEKIHTFKVNGTLTLTLWDSDPDSLECLPIQKEARTRLSNKDAEWTSGNCDSGKEEKDDGSRKLVVQCHVEKNVPHEVQIRHRTSHWSSPWSEWSEPLVVPAEIHESPKVNYTVGRLGRNGLRKVTLKWKKPSPEQGKVTYNLTFVLLPCNCTTEVNWFLDSYQVNLSGAGYYVSLQASNRAGSAPPFVFYLPPAEQDADLPFLHSQLSGKHLSVEWEVTEIEAYCFEEQPLGEEAQGRPCENDFYTDSVKSSAMLEDNRCYRLAAHALDAETGLWFTSAFTHLFSRNTLLEEPIQVRVTNKTTNSAILHWDPPKALLACPHALKKYIICCQTKQAGNVTYHEASASTTHYMILGLQPNTTYWVGVWASTGEADDAACQPVQSFLTRLPGPKQVTSARSSWYLGIFAGLLIATITIFFLGKKRAKEVLCSALPDPANTEAVKVTSIAETAQVRLKQGLIEPLEPSGLAEPFLVELMYEEEPSADAKVESLGTARQVEDFQPPKGDLAGSATGLPLEYNSQGLLNPVDDDNQGQGGWGDFTGVSSEVRAGCGLLSPNEVKVGDSSAPPQALFPLSLALLDTVVVTRNSAEGCGFSAST